MTNDLMRKLRVPFENKINVCSLHTENTCIYAGEMEKSHAIIRVRMEDDRFPQYNKLNNNNNNMFVLSKINSNCERLLVLQLITIGVAFLLYIHWKYLYQINVR